MIDGPDFTSAVRAIVADDRASLVRLLDAGPHLVKTASVEDPRGKAAEASFLTDIAHYLYAGDTLLHMAAAGFRRRMAEDLLSHGADISVRNRRGAQPLHYAADTNRVLPGAQAETINVLLKAGADPNAIDMSGVAPLHRAVRTRGSAAVEALLAGSADPNLKNGNGSAPLHLALRTTGRGGSGTPTAKREQAEIIRLLLAAGANPDACDGQGQSAREVAASVGIDI
ncbi:ankyrin repeat family protein [Asticcacaulis biprosthecium C19]|uniref:Ankyrin repeat family protein n=1 Tax=Asticcacaulis biprosthecium C19 TaxID=715226 RepID=F4QP94_9CAUL|nr:ankyrin repeat domain-containing protein [Asticcacaulis biprosthecium]EGF91152.1 ankyrin repeat family protein [Asticcacaulis biprosthecium C19]